MRKLDTVPPQRPPLRPPLGRPGTYADAQGRSPLNAQWTRGVNHELLGIVIDEPLDERAMMAKVTDFGRDTRLGRLCGRLGLAPDEQRVFVKKFHEHLAAGGRTLTIEEQRALDQLTKSISESAAMAPANRGRHAQFWNNTKAATIAWAAGFGLVTLLTKALGQTSLHKDAIHFVNVAGPLILLCAEVLAGKYRAQGAGYVAVDNAAYLNYSTCVSQLRRVGLHAAGVRARGGAGGAQMLALKGERDALKIKVQTICTGLIRRELGQPLGMKADADVPLLACVRSNLTVDDDDRIYLPDDTHLFSYDRHAAKGKFNVTWPDGVATNLNADVVPRQHADLFEKAEDLLLGAARARSGVCDELTFLPFGMFYAISGSLGPWLLGTTENEQASAAADTVLSIAMCFCGTQALVHGQNAMRSMFSGAPAHSGIYPPLQEAKYELADLRADMLDARVEELCQAHEEVIDDLSRLRSHMRRLDAGATPIEMRHLNACRAREKWLIARQQKLKPYVKAAVKARKAAQLDRQQAGGKLSVTLAGARATWKDYGSNLPQLAARLVGYTATYVFYSEVFMRYIQLLTPDDPQGGVFNQTMANDTSFNQSTGFADEAAQMQGLHNYMAAFAFNGVVLALGFATRNILIARTLEYGFNAIAGGAGYVKARFWDGRNADGTASDESVVDDAGTTEESGRVSDAASGPADLWRSEEKRIRAVLLENDMPADLFEAMEALLGLAAPIEERGLAAVLREHFDVRRRDLSRMLDVLDRTARALDPYLDEIFGDDADVIQTLMNAMKTEEIV